MQHIKWKEYNKELLNIYSILTEKKKDDKIYCCSVAKLCPNLFDPMDCSIPGSSVHVDF